MRLFAVLCCCLLVCQWGWSQVESDPRDLIVAVEKGDVRMVKSLLKKGADVQMSVPSTSPFYLFYIGRDLYLQGLTKSRSSSPVYISPIHANASRANLAVLKVLTKYGANLDARDSRGKTPLMYAIRIPGGQAYARSLLQRGANYTHRDDAGNSALHYAALAGNAQSILLTAAGGIDVNAENSDGMTPFHVAAIKAPVEALQTLLDLGADPRRTDHAGFNALHYAAGYGDRDKVRFLYQLIPDLFLESDSGTNPLDLAHLARNDEVTLFFRKKGHQFGGYRYPEMMAALRDGRHADLRQALREGANPNRPTGEFPLHLAAASGDTAALRILLAFEAKTGTQDTAGRTALEVAINRNQPDAALALLLAGSPVQDAWLPRMAWNLRSPALRSRWSPFVQALADRVEDPDRSGGGLDVPALHIAAYLGLDELAGALLRAGADPTLADAKGWTPLHWAVIKDKLVAGQPEKVRIAKQLLASGSPINARTSAPRLLPHDQPYVARRTPANATALDLLDYALPLDSAMWSLLDSMGGDSTITAADFAENGMELLGLGESNAALVEFNKALRREPRLSEAYCGRGRAKLDLGMAESALIDFDQALVYRAVYPEALLGRGRCHFQMGMLNEADEDLSRAIEQGLRTGEVYFYRAQVRRSTRGKDKACADFRESMQRGYPSAEAAYNQYCQ